MLKYLHEFDEASRKAEYDDEKEVTVNGFQKYPWTHWREAVKYFLYSTWAGLVRQPRISFAGTTIAYDGQSMLYRAYGRSVERDPLMGPNTPISGAAHLLRGPAVPGLVHDAFARLIFNPDITHLVLYFEKCEEGKLAPCISFMAASRGFRMGFSVYAEHLPADDPAMKSKERVHA